MHSLDWTTGMTFELTFELFLLSMKKIAVVLLAKLNLSLARARLSERESGTLQ